MDGGDGCAAVGMFLMPQKCVFKMVKWYILYYAHLKKESDKGPTYVQLGLVNLCFWPSAFPIEGRRISWHGTLEHLLSCLLYTSDAADDYLEV